MENNDLAHKPRHWCYSEAVSCTAWAAAGVRKDGRQGIKAGGAYRTLRWRRRCCWCCAARRASVT